MGKRIQMGGFTWAGFLCLALAALKLTIEGHWSWWRVLLPLWVVLGHNALYIAVGFIWISLIDGGPVEAAVTIDEDHHPNGYQLAAMLCFLIFIDNLLGRIEGNEKAVWFWLRPGGWELIFVAGVLSAVCQLLFWRAVVRPGLGPILVT